MTTSEIDEAKGQVDARIGSVGVDGWDGMGFEASRHTATTIRRIRHHGRNHLRDEEIVGRCHGDQFGRLQATREARPTAAAKPGPTCPSTRRDIRGEGTKSKATATVARLGITLHG